MFILIMLTIYTLLGYFCGREAYLSFKEKEYFFTGVFIAFALVVAYCAYDGIQQTKPTLPGISAEQITEVKK